MIPGFEFRFFICTYLPGVPLSVALYYLIIQDRIRLDITWYMIITPLIIGLFLDGVRHTVKYYFPEWRIFCQPIEKDDLNDLEKDYGQVFTSQLITDITTFYHVYEFFINFGLSCSISFILMGIYSEKICWEFLWLANVIMIVLCIIFARTFLLERERLINRIKNGSEAGVGATGASEGAD